MAYRHADSDPAALEAGLVRPTRLLPAAARPGAAYCISKAFVIWYSSQLAAAYGARGARVVSVSPGSCDTDLGRLEEQTGAGQLVEYAAIERMASPAEIAAVLAFAAGPAPGYLTGTDILVDGGARAGLGVKGRITLARDHLAPRDRS